MIAGDREPGKSARPRLAPRFAAACSLGLLLAGCGAGGWRWDPDRPVVPPLDEAARGAAGAPGAADEPRSKVILLPDADGGVGEVDVTTPDGVETLSTAFEGLYLEPPRERFVTTAEAVAARYVVLIEALPPAAATWTIYFELDSVEVTEASRAAMAEMLAAIVTWPAADLRIDGHADRSGTDDRNLALSKARTEAVRDAVLGAGASPADLVLGWHGETRPAKSTDDGVREPLNRRVVVYVR